MKSLKFYMQIIANRNDVVHIREGKSMCIECHNKIMTCHKARE